jgi:UDP-N-acetylglucosamine--N-acetylmuramyl-(pentapeptide) pyrophosphoryl-undecaprenol N-acetylglucosamine transferase
MTMLCVATNGGHLSQLVELEKRMPGNPEDRHWVTFDTAQSRSLLAGRRTTFIKPIEERDVLGVCRGFIDAHSNITGKSVEAVVSTGSAIAIPFITYATIRGIPAHYIESAARVGSPSLTGRVLQCLPGVKLYRQYPSAAGGRWTFSGSVFEGFCSGPTQKRKVKNIVVTLGTGTHPFRRLIEKLVRILPPDSKVLWQTGSTSVSGLNITAQPIVPARTLDEAIAGADVVIGHAGCGTALAAMNAKKFAILIPREPQYGELVDSHQVEIARWLGQRKLVLHRNPDSLSLDDIYFAAQNSVDLESNPPAFNLV